MAAIDTGRLRAIITEACVGVPDVEPERVQVIALGTLYDEISSGELGLAPILAARGLVETEPGYLRVATRLLADGCRRIAP